MWVDFEGIDGSGKTTISVRVARRLRAAGLTVHHPREDGHFSSKVSERIRDLTRDADSFRMSAETELLLNAAREAQTIAETIRPALTSGAVVITDRALYSHVAMAQFVRGLPRDASQGVADFAAGRLWPDLVIHVDVDPYIARLRKRVRRIRESKYQKSGRKGMLGQLYPRLCRQAFRAMGAADPERWRLLENSLRTADEAEDEAFAMVAAKLGLEVGGPRGRATLPHLESGDTLEAQAAALFDFAEAVSGRDPALAALLVGGMDHPRAAALVRKACDTDPDVAAYAVAGMASPWTWDVRRRAAASAPAHVARGLKMMLDENAWDWRAQLEGVTPDQVLHSLAGIGTEQAHAMRARLWDASPDEGLHSLAGLADGASWRYRLRALRQGPSAAVAESLTGLVGDAAWALRERLRAAFPVSVLRSVRGLADERAWPMRDDMARQAPRAVLETIEGVSGAAAERLRDSLQADLPDEVAASLNGLVTDAAWDRRRSLLDAAPAGVLSGLVRLAGDPLALAIAEEAHARGRGEIRCARKAALFHLRCGMPRVEERASVAPHSATE